MATKTWIGAAPATRHRNDFTLSAVPTVGHFYWLALNGRIGPRILAETGETAASMVAKLAAAYAAAGPEFAELGYNPVSTTLQVTGPADGRDPQVQMAYGAPPFSSPLSISDTEPVVGTGGGNWDNPANWSGGSVPVAGDDLVFAGGQAPKYGLPGSGTAFGSVTFRPESAGAGLPEVSPLGYVEYLSVKRLVLNHAGDVTVQTPNLVRVQSAAGAARTFVVAATPTAAGGGLDLITDSFNHVLVVTAGRCVVAAGAGEAAKLAVATVSSDPATDVTLGAGVTLANLNQAGGTVSVKCGATGTITHTGGDLLLSGAGAVAAVADSGGRVFDSGTGTVTAYTAGGSYSYTGSAGRTVTTLTGKAGGRFVDRAGKVTVANAVVMTGCHLPGPPGDVGPAPFYLSVGTGRAVTV